MRSAILILACLLLQGCAGLLVAGTTTTALAMHDRRSLGTQVDDQTLELKAVQALNADAALREHTHISGIALNGQLLLVGQAKTEHLRNQAVAAVRQLEGVNSLQDQIRVQSPTTLLTRSNDSWLTTRIKTALLADKSLDGSRIKVVTENSEVFLLGLVSRQEASQAVEIARHTPGVKRVVKVFQLQ